MLDFVEGIIEDLEKGRVLLAAGEFGFEVRTPASLTDDLKRGEFRRLYTHLTMNTRTGGFTLYGFSDRDERNLFELLLEAIGPKTALTVLNIGKEAVVNAVRNEDKGMLQALPGVGDKNASKIFLNLKKKIEKEFAQIEAKEGISKVESEAILALIGLGFSERESLQAVRSVEGDDRTEVTSLIKAALSQIRR